MEENINNQNTMQQIEPQSQQEKRPPLMPGQESEDELDYVGGVLVNLTKKGFFWIKNLFAGKKVE